MEDALELWQGVMGIGTWSKKHFVLSGNILSYSSHKDGALEGKVHMQVASVEPGPPNTAIFKINTGVQSLKLKSDSINSKNRWLNSLFTN
jgi:hypothetical protein